MSAYDPYRFLPPQARPLGSQLFHPQSQAPRYGSPDLSPSEPMADNGYPNDGKSEEQEGNHADAGPSNGSGPSRKRTRIDDEGVDRRASGGASSSQGRMPVPVSNGSRPRARPIPPSMFGVDARNDLTREVGAWLVATCQGLSDVEIEIKLGRIIHPRRGNDPPTRIHLPVHSEKTVYSTDFPHTFMSDMSKREHGTLNALLNGTVEHPPDPMDRIMYKRIRQRDSFYRYEGRRIRVSTLAETGEVTDVIEKTKVDHLNIFCPNSSLDLRISVSTETKCEMPEGDPEDVRVKDRISYSNSVCQTDLTYVTFGSKHTFEVEVEVIDAPGLLFDSQNDPDRFDKKLISCLDTARILVRNASST